MTAVSVPPGPAGTAVRTSSNRWIGLSGVLFGVLLAASVFMTAGMPAAKHAAKVQAWDVKHTGLLGGAVVLTTLAVIVGLFFLTWLHSLLARDGGWMGTVFVTGVVVFALSGVVAAGLQAVLSHDAKHLSAGSLQLMASLEQNLNFPMTAAGLALMYLAAGFLIRRSGLLPGWLAWVSWVFAVLAATVLLAFIPLLGTGLFVVGVGIALTVRPPAEG